MMTLMREDNKFLLDFIIFLLY